MGYLLSVIILFGFQIIFFLALGKKEYLSILKFKNKDKKLSHILLMHIVWGIANLIIFILTRK